MSTASPRTVARTRSPSTASEPEPLERARLVEAGGVDAHPLAKAQPEHDPLLLAHLRADRLRPGDRERAVADRAPVRGDAASVPVAHRHRVRPRRRGRSPPRRLPAGGRGRRRRRRRSTRCASTRGCGGTPRRAARSCSPRTARSRRLRGSRRRCGAGASSARRRRASPARAARDVCSGVPVSTVSS